MKKPNVKACTKNKIMATIPDKRDIVPKSVFLGTDLSQLIAFLILLLISKMIFFV